MTEKILDQKNLANNRIIIRETGLHHLRPDGPGLRRFQTKTATYRGLFYFYESLPNTIISAEFIKNKIAPPKNRGIFV
jgi:hypothetical protein